MNLIIEKRIQRLEKFPPYGKVVEAEFTLGTEKKVYHGLGYSPNGYIVVNYKSNSNLWISSSSVSSSEYLNLTYGSGGGTEKVKIWFF